jgi:hypothetical protein
MPERNSEARFPLVHGGAEQCLIAFLHFTPKEQFFFERIQRNKISQGYLLYKSKICRIDAWYLYNLWLEK